MLEGCKSAQERCGEVHLLIDRWLADRKKLIEAFSTLDASPETLGVDRKALQEFCEVLVDYCSAGHFEIYDQLNREAKAFGDDRGLELADNKLYPRIVVITQAAIAFNDHCDNGDWSHAVDVAADFKALGHLLDERFELEDCLIEVLHTSHKEGTPA